MDVRQLRYFLAVVDADSVHQAAARLRVAQPSVSQALRKLERELGCELFHRVKRRLVLNAAGQALVEPARELVRSLDVVKATVQAVDGVSGGRLAISSMPSQAVSPLASLIGGFLRRHPGVEVGVSTAARPEDVCDAVRDGAAEVGLVAVPNGPLREPGLRVVPLEVQRFVLVARDPDDLPGGTGPLRPEELRGLGLVVGQRGTGMRRAADAVLAATDCRVAVRVEQREALLPLVLAGAGVAVVADSWRPLALAAGLVVRPLAVDESLHVALVAPGTRPTPAAAAFLEAALD
ncbi:LysR family transcriptional regulator [Umezawaea sp. Da 62-37]|uniref:LysR family transcriptional regulator n=1 Tax=Umezawaea sp. Da 62-37 TaxID=3075927 RepID=UPI0028F74B67|nr:LysR family transcriptional regulator [Umezawaea sp. Da 62-37]WNV86144.1 LysR family transcriptional regulator [Umezawaea sp. Da 62-37]